jgi:hypothetical protein
MKSTSSANDRVSSATRWPPSTSAMFTRILTPIPPLTARRSIRGCSPPNLQPRSHAPSWPVRSAPIQTPTAHASSHSPRPTLSKAASFTQLRRLPSSPHRSGILAGFANRPKSASAASSMRSNPSSHFLTSTISIRSTIRAASAPQVVFAHARPAQLPLLLQSRPPVLSLAVLRLLRFRCGSVRAGAVSSRLSGLWTIFRLVRSLSDSHLDPKRSVRVTLRTAMPAGTIALVSNAFQSRDPAAEFFRPGVLFSPLWQPPTALPHLSWELQVHPLPARLRPIIHLLRPLRLPPPSRTYTSTRTNLSLRKRHKRNPPTPIFLQSRRGHPRTASHGMLRPARALR